MNYTPREGVTQSLLTDFLACRHRTSLILAGWEAKRQKKSFRFGSLIHDTLQFIYNGMHSGVLRHDTPRDIDPSISQEIQRLVRDNLAQASARAEDTQDIEMEGAMAEALLCGPYLREWSSDWDRKWVGIESVFDVDFEGWRLRGKQDAVFVEANKGKGKSEVGTPRIWLLETKTKSQIAEDDLNLALAFDFQTLFYLEALEIRIETLLRNGDLPKRPTIAGCLYNIIRVPALRPREGGKGKKAESSQEFIARTKADIAERPDHYFKRFELSFPHPVREQFRQQLRGQLADFAAWTKNLLRTYRNPSACLTRYKCEFLEHCASGGFAEYAQTRELFAELAPARPPAPVAKTAAAPERRR